jgi:hypothetical protein
VSESGELQACLAGLLRAEEPFVAPLDGPEPVDEIPGGEAAGPAVAVRVQQVGAHAAELVHLHRVPRRPRGTQAASMKAATASSISSMRPSGPGVR